MIIPVSEINIKLFKEACAMEHVFGSKCLNAFYIEPETCFCQTDEDGLPCNGMYLNEGVLVMAGNGKGDIKELAVFIKDKQIKEIDADFAQSHALSSILGGTMESSFYMEYKGSFLPGDYSFIQKSDSLEDVFSVLQQSHEYYRDHLTFDHWAKGLMARLEHGYGELYIIYKNQLPIATGSIISQDDECAVIAAVAVIPDCRHRRLGTLISSFLTNQILEKGKTPRLISGYDAVADLYGSIGYVEIGRWGELYL